MPELPLRVVSTTPSDLSTVEPFDGPVVIRFERNLSETLTSGAPATSVVVSPQVGEVQVEMSGDALRISMDGGFRETTVYRITVLPRFQDRYRNTMGRPLDLVFSTGPELEPNLLAGIVTDRLTLEPATDTRVDAVDPEGIAHSTVTDSAGIFALPYLPSGAYRVGAYEDRNQDRTADFTEPQDSAEVTLSAGDTLLVTDLALLESDTTAAALQEVVQVDSLTLRARFDDLLDPDASLAPVQAEVGAVDRDLTAPVSEVLHVWEWEARRAEADAAADADAQGAAAAPAGDPGPVDPGGAVQPTPGGAAQPPAAQPPDPPQDPAPDPPQAQGQPQAQDQDPGPPLPARELILILGLELGSGIDWEVTLTDVPNINGVPGGGGTVPLEIQAPAPTEPEPTPDADAPAGAPAEPDPDAPAGAQPDPDAPAGATPDADPPA